MRSAVLLPLLLLAPCASAGIPRDVVVALAPGAPAASARPVVVVSLAEALGLTARGRLDDGLAPMRGAAHAFPWRIDPARVLLFAAPDSTRAAIAAAALAHAPGVAWTEVAVSRDPAVVRVAGAPGFPADPMFADTRQWGLWNAGPAGVYGGRAGADIHARAAWALTTGSAQVRLAVADTGVDPAHPELAGTLPDGSPRVAFARDVTADALPAMADSFGHGTLVAGVIAARTGEGAHFDSLGVAGVCGGDGGANPGCVLVPIRITRGHTGSASSTDVARALLYAAEVGARAVNLSFASPWPSRLERLAIAEALAHGTVTVCAAGNHGYTQGPAPQYPAAHSADGLCVQVGASDPWDARAVFSSYGPGLDLMAPGVDVWTTFMTYASAAGAVYDGYVAASGTSFAAPFVTGTIGLLAAVRPELAADDFQSLLRRAADDVGDPGLDAFTGAGRLNAARALELVGPDRALAHRVLAADAWRLVAVDTLRIDEPGVSVLDSLGRRALAQRWETSATLALPDSFADSTAAWVRVTGTTTLRDDFHLPWLAPWATIEWIGARTLRVRGSLLRLVDARLGDAAPVDSMARWIPVAPESARFAITLLGPRAAPVSAPPPRPQPHLALAPNPARSAVRLQGGPGERVDVFDVRGRRIAGFELSARGDATWNGRDDRGRLAPPGLYLVRAAGRVDARLVWLPHPR